MDLSIVSWNANGIMAHLDDFTHFLSKGSCSADIICLQETHLTCNSLFVNGYSIITKNRVWKKGGGVAILIKNTFRFEEIPVEGDMEAVGCKLFCSLEKGSYDPKHEQIKGSNFIYIYTVYTYHLIIN